MPTEAPEKPKKPQAEQKQGNATLRELLSQSNRDWSQNPQTYLSTWEELSEEIKRSFLSKESTDCLNDYEPVGVHCSICKKSMINQNWVINVSWKHIYHPSCIINHCKEYLSKCQYPRNCPSRGCKKILGPQEITKHLSEDDFIKFEAFSLQRAGQKSRKQLLWCKTCHIIFAVSYDEKLVICRNCMEKPMKFQEVLKHLNQTSKLEESQEGQTEQI